MIETGEILQTMRMIQEENFDYDGYQPAGLR